MPRASRSLISAPRGAPDERLTLLVPLVPQVLQTAVETTATVTDINDPGTRFAPVVVLPVGATALPVFDIVRGVFEGMVHERIARTGHLRFLPSSVGIAVYHK